MNLKKIKDSATGYEELINQLDTFLDSEKEEEVLTLKSPVSQEDIDKAVSLYMEHYQGDEVPEFILSIDKINESQVRVKCVPGTK